MKKERSYGSEFRDIEQRSYDISMDLYLERKPRSHGIRNRNGNQEAMDL
jgi:hypothetical protein